MHKKSSTSDRDKIPLIEQCAAICEQCLADLDTPDCLGNEEIVHALRVATKRLRAAWHLVKAVDRKFAKNRRAALRELSACISDQRDQHVLITLASDLATESHQHAAFAPLIVALTENSESAPTVSASLDTVREGWAAEFAAWHSLDSALADSTKRRKILRHALRKSERRATRRSRDAIAEPKADAELWHEWRKAVKRVRYQREFVAATQGRQLGVRDGRITRLGTRLGERNDLTILIAAVETLSELSPQQHGLIRKTIARRERKVMSSARRLGNRAFLR